MHQAVHVFDNAYSPDRFNPDSWIGKHFFTGPLHLVVVREAAITL